MQKISLRKLVALEFSTRKCRLLVVLILGGLLALSSTEVYAQDDKPAKAKKVKIRNTKRSTERAKRNPRVKETRFKMRTKKGDRAVNRDLTGRRVKQNRRSPAPRTNYSNYKPASRRSQYRSKSRSTYAPQRIRTASRKGEQSPRGDISGKRIRTTRSSGPSRNRISFNARNPYVQKRGKPQEGRKTYRSTYVRSASGQNRRTPSYMSAPNPYVAKKRKPSEGRKRYSSPSIRSRTARDARSRNASSGQKVKRPRTSGRSTFARGSRGGVRSTGSQPGSRASSFRNRGVRSTRTQPGSRASSFKNNRAKSISGNIRNRRPSNPFAVANTRSKRKGDVARNRDITGRRLRENKRSPRQHVTVNAPSPKRESRGERSLSNKKQLARTARSQKPGGRFAKTSFGGVRTSARSGENATNRSASGKSLRTRNMRSGRPSFGARSYPGYLTRTKRGEGGFSGKSARIRSSSKPGESAGVQFGGFRTATAKGERSTNRDIAGKRIRTRNKESRTTRIVGLPQNRRLSRSGELRNNNGRSLESKPPGRGTLQGGSFGGSIRAARSKGEGPGSKYSGNVRYYRSPKGGGSITRLRNNNGRALAARKPGRGTISGGRYGGNIRAREPKQGGGSITRLRNNNGKALAGRKPGRGTISGGRYSGNIRAREPKQGGGSITRLRNNNGNPLAARKPGKGTIAGGRFSGNISKGANGKPGRGTIQGGNFKGTGRSQKGFYTDRPYAIRTQRDDRLHNNKGNPLGSRMVGRGTIQGASFRGNIRKKEIGQSKGTTYHGRIARRSLRPGRDAIAGSKYSGNLRKGPPTKPGRGTIQGGNFKGNNRTRKGFYNTERYYSFQTQQDQKLHNNKGNPLDGRKVGRGTIQGATYKGNLRASRNLKPGKGTKAGYRYQGELRASRNLKPGKGTRAGYRYQGNMRASRSERPGRGTIAGYRYHGDMRKARANKHQKAGDALKASQPWYQIGRLRADKYSGSYRYRAPSRKDQHISSAFSGFNPGNAKKENERFFKFKIWFARLFRNETPRHMKNKGRKPRYDKGESEIWYR